MIHIFDVAKMVCHYGFNSLPWSLYNPHAISHANAIMWHIGQVESVDPLQGHAIYWHSKIYLCHLFVPNIAQEMTCAILATSNFRYQILKKG